MNKIIEYLDEIFPNPKPELNYKNEFEFLIAIVLSAQATDKRVNIVTKDLFEKYDMDSIIETDIEEIEDILKTLGMYKKKAFFVKSIAYDIKYKYNKKIPDSLEELMSLNGVGRKVANVYLGEIHKKQSFAVDTHVSRVSKRLGIAKEKDNVLVVEKKLCDYFFDYDFSKLHLQMVLFGRYKCKARNPICFDCKLKSICKYENKNV